MSQGLFLVALGAGGFAITAPLHSRVPSMFFSVSSLLWGATAWVTCTLLTFFLPIPFNLPAMGALYVLMCVIALSIGIARRTLRLETRAIASLLLLLTIFMIISILAVSYPLIPTDEITSDSFFITSIGYGLGRHDTPQSGLVPLLSWGSFMVTLHAVAPLIGATYISSLTPCLFLTAIVTMGWLVSRMLNNINRSGNFQRSVVLSLLAIAVYLSPWMIRREAIHIHTPLSSTAFVVIALGSFWLGQVEHNNAWETVTVAGLIGLSFTRLESPILVLELLIIMLSVHRLPYKKRLSLVVPVAGTLLFWLCLLFPVARSASSAWFLTGYRYWAVLISVAGMLAASIFARGKWFDEKLLAHLQWGPIALGGGVLLAGLAFKTDHILTSLINQGTALTSPWWGTLTWGALLVAWLVLRLIADSEVNFAVFEQFIPAFTVTIAALALFRGPYHSGLRDSSNRMFTIIFPVLVLVVIVTLATSQRSANSACQVRD